MTEEDQNRDIPLVWIGLEDLSILLTNQFLVQHWQDIFVFSAGQLVPPPVTGTPQEQQEEIEQLSYIPVMPVVRLALTRERVEELIVYLQASLDQYDRKQREQYDEAEGGGI